MTGSFVFGPIASRRLGRSLGIDLMQQKICCQDCIYCEAGRTATLTCTRKEYVPTEEVLQQLDQVLQQNPELDYITFSGAGEPTLHSRIGEVIRFLKTRYPQHKVCVLTNGMLLGSKTLQQELLPADLIIPSLDASCEEEFLRINRPAEEISFAAFIAGMQEFTHLFPGQVWLELFIVPKVNDSDRSIARFAEIIRSLKVDKIQLNTLDRPGTEEDVAVSSRENAEHFARILRTAAPVEIIHSFRQQPVPDQTAESLLPKFLAQAPADLPAIKNFLGLSFFETDLVIKKLLFSGTISKTEKNGNVIYYLKEHL